MYRHTKDSKIQRVMLQVIQLSQYLMLTHIPQPWQQTSTQHSAGTKQTYRPKQTCRPTEEDPKDNYWTASQSLTKV